MNGEWAGGWKDSSSGGLIHGCMEDGNLSDVLVMYGNVW